MLFRSALAAAATALTVAAVPAVAPAASLTTDLPCYPEGYPVTFSGSGWSPNTQWGLSAGGSVFQSGSADVLGSFTSRVAAPNVVPDTVAPQKVTVVGTQDGSEVASVSFRVVNFMVKLDSDRGRPTGKTTWRFSGFSPGSTVYVHIRRGGKTLSNTRIGTSSSPCGTGKRRLARLPGVAHPRSGTYKVFVDGAKQYSPKTSPQMRGSYIVYTTYR